MLQHLELLLYSQCGGFDKFPGGNYRPQRAVATFPSFFITQLSDIFELLNRLHDTDFFRPVLWF